MLADNIISVFFHMRNHYRKLRQVQSVIDCCPPDKGPPQKFRSNKATSGRSKTGSPSRDSNHTSRPQTRRNYKEMPSKEAKKLSNKKIKHKSKPQRSSSVPPCESINPLKCKSVSNEHEYLQFSLRITEEIIKNDLYGNEQMLKVLQSHYNANKTRLDEFKLRKTIEDLCYELNIPYNDTVKDIFKSQSNGTVVRFVDEEVCACKYSNTANCTCPCNSMNTNIIPLDSSALTQVPSPSINRPNSPHNELKYLQNCKSSDSDVNISEIKSMLKSSGPAIEVIHKAESNNTRSDNDSGRVNFMVDSNHCQCGDESCDQITCRPPQQPQEVTADTFTQHDYIEKEKEVNTDKSVICVDNNTSTDVFTQNKETLINVCCDITTDANLSLTKFDDISQCVCPDFNDIRFKKYLKYYEKTLKHAENIKSLQFCHHCTSIEPCETNELSVQTSAEHLEDETTHCSCCCNQSIQSDEQTNSSNMIVQPHPRRYSIPSSVTAHQNRNDYVLVDGPVLVLKDTVKRSKEVLSGVSSKNDRNHSGSCVTGSRIHSPSRTKKLNTNIPLESLYHRVANPCKNDYDLTPQKDLCEKRYTSTALNSCTCSSDHKNLLLGNRYERYQRVNETLSAFYPTIATQVSSMELLDNKMKIEKSVPTSPTKDYRHVENQRQPKTEATGIGDDSISTKDVVAQTKRDTSQIAQQLQTPVVDVGRMAQDIQSIPSVDDSCGPTKLRSELEKLNMNAMSKGGVRSPIRKSLMDDENTKKSADKTSVLGSLGSIEKKLQSMREDPEKYHMEGRYSSIMKKDEEAPSSPGRDGRVISISEDVDVIKEKETKLTDISSLFSNQDKLLANQMKRVSLRRNM